ncbi:MAG TPA: transglycosylase domain-containing protein [Spirochaetota bacterium]|nr:transglycosylase domain-containing protein [Spirochaetota bacterium]HPF05866.1 transglycosylase domain-containing protein [Spirochaetota bacterium]HPJ40705.1 transglycosylase domain-containing protein [Spirochaetota bacterium]HPR35974.1 transglycosylase domain-containing protein [Spirochaetota bacterium]HRX45888.1 transglycosylase domain-containing protein [Spirochaetota bacterium]
MPIIRWIFSHKTICFLYIPLTAFLLIFIYSAFVYMEWRSDRTLALDRLARYKQLIDRTEEMKKGYPYTQNEIDINAKAVDIPTRIYDRNGVIIGEFFEQKREIVPFDYIPDWLVKGVISSEDRDFYNHRGISFIGISRAMIKNVLSFGVVQGGSTITQQLAKVLFTDMERNLKRKIYEAYCAREIENLYDKQDILSMYLNLIYFGNGSYGVESTAKMFFGKSVRDLDVTECAMIVATISNPGYYSPLMNINNSVTKTKRILYSISDAGYLKEEKIESLYKEFIRKWEIEFDENKRITSSKIGSFIYSSYRINLSPFFNERIRRELVERFGEDAVKKGGLSVYTTIDALKQEAAVKSLRNGIQHQRDYHLKISQRLKNTISSEKEKLKASDIEGALISLNPHTGEILSYVGGFDFTSTNQNDNIYQSRRQPGSSIKPLVYAAAIENKTITPSTLFTDKPMTFKNGYSPQNYGKKYYGDVTARTALIKSLNTIAVQILDKTGYDRVFSYIRKALSLSDSEMDKRFSETLSFGLGAYEISPLESAVLNSLFINGGKFILPYGIKTVKDYNGNIIWDNEKEIIEKMTGERDKTGTIMDPAAGRVTISMLEGISESDSSVNWLLKKYGINFSCAGKTGTTSNYYDAWFVGYNSSLVTTVWIGNKSGSISLGEGRSASGIAAPVWAEYISSIYRNESPEAFNSSIENITTENICIDSGEVAGKNGECPRTAVQYYLSGTEPGRFCHIHVTNYQ